MRMIDLRCDGIRRSGPMAGQRCGLLLIRYTVDTAGVVEVKCPRCYTLRVWPLRALVGVST